MDAWSWCCATSRHKLGGSPSHGMVLCALNEVHTRVKLVSVPVDARVGERVVVPGSDFEGEEGKPFAENNVGKKKVFEKIAPFLKTSEYGVLDFGKRPLPPAPEFTRVPSTMIQFRRNNRYF